VTDATERRDAERADAASERRKVFTSKAFAAVVAATALLAIVEFVPGLEAIRVFAKPRPVFAPVPAPPQASSAVGEAVLDLSTEDRPDLAQPEVVGAVARKQGPIAAEKEPDEPLSDPPPIPIVDESRSLDRLFRSLERTERKEAGALTRIVVFGDSVVASDFGTGTLRRLTQKRFGDGGHGFVLVANAWPQYFHNDVYRMADKGFRVSRIVGPRVSDKLYGLGGVSFSGPPGLRSRIGTAKTGTFGRSVSRFGIAYVAEPGGGVIQVSVDGNSARTIDTDAPEKRPAFTELSVPEGEHELELLTTKSTVRLFGVVLERDQPGVVVDAIGVVGARLRTFDEIDPDNFGGALAWRKPNLVVFQFGANESGDGFAYPMPEYHKSMKALLERVGRAVPDSACLVIGAMDRARKEGDRLVTVPIIPHIVDEQKSVASEIGCAFFNTFEAMGGRGSMAVWVRKGFGAGDYTHPTSWGADKLGNWIYAALIAKYGEYRTR
jgi:lysophospholipase L1-like esterase